MINNWVAMDCGSDLILGADDANASWDVAHCVAKCATLQKLRCGTLHCKVCHAAMFTKC